MFKISKLLTGFFFFILLGIFFSVLTPEEVYAQTCSGTTTVTQAESVCEGDAIHGFTCDEFTTVDTPSCIWDINPFPPPALACGRWWFTRLSCTCFGLPLSCSEDCLTETEWYTSGCVVSGPTPTPTPTPVPPDCSVSLSPSSLSVLLGGTGTFTSSVSIIRGSVEGVRFSSSNNSIATVSPGSDSRSPYITTANGVNSGSVTITTQVVMDGSVRCSDTSTFTVTAPTCSVSLIPSADSTGIGTSTTFSALVSVGRGSVNRVSFSSSNTSIATVSPSSDKKVPYTTNATGVSSGTTTISAKVEMGGSIRCSDTSTLTILTPSCSVELNPTPVIIDVGETSSLFAIPFNVKDGTIERVDFSSDNSSIASVNPASDSSPAYITNVTGNIIGETTVRGKVIMAGASRCTDTARITVENPDPWWQVKGGDVMTGANLISSIPFACVSSGSCDSNFITDGSGGFPGLPAFAGASSYGKGTVSSSNWEANTGYKAKGKYDYSVFKRKVHPEVVFNEIVVPLVSASTFTSGGTLSRGYYWYLYDGTKVGATPLTITDNLDLGDRKVVLFVKGADLIIKGNISLNDGRGFLMTIVQGKTQINSSVTSLEGIFVSDNNFETGTGASQLTVRGTIVSYGRVRLQRDLTDNSVTPAETFTFAPDLLLNLPRSLQIRRIDWKEVAP